jgi:hypothetical protein
MVTCANGVTPSARVRMIADLIRSPRPLSPRLVSCADIDAASMDMYTVLSPASASASIFWPSSQPLVINAGPMSLAIAIAIRSAIRG